MMNRLLALLGIPAMALGLLFAGTWFARRMGWITEGVAYYLYPSLVALAFLVFAIIAFLREKRLWVWPLGVGFFVQFLGIFWLALDPLPERPLKVYLHTFGAVAVVLLIMGGIWLVNYFRARKLEGRMAEDPEIKKNMMDALALLRRAGRGRNAVYELPWFLVMGRPAAGKTIAIKNSGLTLPVKKDWVKGVGGTYTVNFFFTNSLIFVDTPGKWVAEGADGESKSLWTNLARLLKKFRGMQPLDGLIVVVPADDLLSKDADELADQAANIREVVDLLHKQLTFRFPIYLLVTKSDLIEGFVDLFKSFGQNRRDEILGWSNPEPNKGDAGTLVRKGFRRLYKRLVGYRLDMLGRVKSRTRARKLFFFPEEFKSLEEPLVSFADEFFGSDRYHESPVFRGFYFTSGMQEGAPLSKAFAAIARTMGVTAKGEQFSEEEPSKSYFLLDLFRERMVDDDGLVGRTTGHWWKRRRATMLGAFAPAGLAVALLLLSTVSFFWNKAVYKGHARNAEKIVQTLDDFGTNLTPANLDPILDETGQLRADYLKISSFSPLRSLGMRRPADLEQSSLDLFCREFRDHVLRPSLEEAQYRAMDTQASCVDRLDYLHSVMRLRMAEAFQDAEDLSSFNDIWQLERSMKGPEIQEKFRVQYGTYAKGAIDNPLPGFSIKNVAGSIRDDCGQVGSASSLAVYLTAQAECETAVSDQDVEICLGGLHEALAHDASQYERFQEKLTGLKTDLEKVQSQDGDASLGLEAIQEIAPLQEGKAKTCVENFDNVIRGEVQDYLKVGLGDFVDDCRTAVAAQPNWELKRIEFMKISPRQATTLEGLSETVDGSFKDQNFNCAAETQGGQKLKYPVIEKVAIKGLRAQCLPAPKVVDRPIPSGKPTKPKELAWLERGSTKRNYSAGAWETHKQDWLMLFDALKGGVQNAAEEQGKINARIRNYAVEYAKHWDVYLDSIRLKPKKGSVIDWLGELGRTSEYKDVLEPAAQAISSGYKVKESQFSVMSTRLEGIAQVPDFVRAGLPNYQKQLGDVSKDLETLSEDPAGFLNYQRELQRNDRNNSIVEALDWVDANAGTAKVGAQLHAVLMRPLEEARDYVLQSDSPIKAKWTEVVDLYDQEIKNRAPLAADVSAGADVVDTESLGGLLGKKTGLVVKFRELIGDNELSRDAREWLTTAEQWSDLLFEDGSDKLRPVKLTAILGEVSYDSKKTEKEYELAQVDFRLGEDARLLWRDDGSPRRDSLELDLFPQSGFAYVRGILTKKKGFFGRAVGRNWAELDETTATTAGETAEFEGELAPLMLIDLGQRGSEGGPTTLQFQIADKSKKKEIPTATFTIELDGKEIEELLELLDQGLLGPPPKSITGGS